MSIEPLWIRQGISLKAPLFTRAGSWAAGKLWTTAERSARKAQDGLVRRTTTRDVDILARMEEGELVTAKPLPNWLREDARDVGAELGLPDGWFNTGPSDESFFRLGLPEGLASRVVTREYVVAHEICHLKHPNHGAEFYRQLDLLVPDWRQVKRRLECSEL
jgi:hypothetical protein